MILILTKKQLEEEKKRSKNLGWPYLPAIYEIPPKKRKPYIYGWKNNVKRQALYGKKCHVLMRGRMNSALVEFENGQKEIISRNALRR